ncbi:MAG TPA: hypothetical protein VGK87_10615, partial [Anaerolineae bacterium]
MLIKRILGLVITLTAILGIVGCIIAIVAVSPVLDRVATSVDSNVTTISDTLDTISDTIQFAQDTSSQVIIGLGTAETSVLNTATIISQTRPMLSNAGEIITVDMAGSLDQVQATIPTLAQLAGNVDKTLTFLNNVNILGIRLGIDYNPSVPLAQSITAIGDSFNGVPDKLRSMAADLKDTNRGLDTTTVNLVTIGTNLHDINASFSKFSGQFAQYLHSTTVIKQQLQTTRNELRNDLQLIKVILVVLLVWVLLTQLAPLVVGINMLTDRRKRIEVP